MVESGTPPTPSAAIAASRPASTSDSDVVGCCAVARTVPSDPIAAAFVNVEPTSTQTTTPAPIEESRARRRVVSRHGPEPTSRG